MTTHELAQALLARGDVVVSETLAKRLLEKPAGKDTLNECWCGCGGTTKGKFVPGHDSRFHSLAKKVARGEEEAPAEFVNDDAEADFIKWMEAEEAKLAVKARVKAAIAAAKEEAEDVEEEAEATAGV